MSDKFHLTKSSSNTHLLPKYNVLVLGETQSGKSTLIQYMRKYANPNVEINTKALGTGFLSHTQEVTVTDISTDLPEYYVQEKKGVERVSYGDFLKIPDEYDYEDALNMRKGLETKKGAAQLPKKVKFNLIDTPGLNATQGDDEKRVQKIFRGLNEAKTIHLLLITISSGPFTQGLKDAIRAYVDMFPGFNGIIAFVHTHFDYKNFHPERSQVSRAIDLRTKSLHEIMGRTTFPHFKIDCEVYNKKPIRDCITQNTIRKILGLAILSQPINVLHTVIHKTRKMRNIDNILRDKFEATCILSEQIPQFKNADEGELLAGGFCNEETRIDKLDPRMEELKERPRTEREGVGPGKSFEGIPTYTEQQCWEKDRQSLCKTCLSKFGRMALPQRSVLDVKHATTSLNVDRKDIKQRRNEQVKLEERLQVATDFPDNHALKNEAKKQQIKEICEKIQIQDIVRKDYLAPEVFDKLILAEAYKGDTAVCAKKVLHVYRSLVRGYQGSTAECQEP